MAAIKGPRLQVGSAPWIDEERASSLQIIDEEVEEFSYSARNELEWLNEHMAGIFNENEINFAEVFKSPGKPNSKTPQTSRKQGPSESRMPLSDVFTSTPNGPRPQPSAQIGRFKPPQLHALSRPSPLGVKPTSPKRAPVVLTKSAEPARPLHDSGYHGSQDANLPDGHVDFGPEKSQTIPDSEMPTSTPLRLSPVRQAVKLSPEKVVHDTREEETNALTAESVAAASYAEKDKEALMAQSNEGYGEVDDYVESYTPQHSPTANLRASGNSDEGRSSSEASSPIRPLGRKSSLNFASLPAREPLGGRLSRTGHLDNSSNRTSYYQRATGGKSLGNLTRRDSLDDEGQDAMNIDTIPAKEAPETERQSLTHSRAYTQRLHDQITMLGQSQGQVIPAKAAPIISTMPHNVSPSEPSTTPNSPHKHLGTTTPDGSHEDNDDDWIEPPRTVEDDLVSGATLSKSFTADIMEGIYSKGTLGQPDFDLPKAHRIGSSVSPQKDAVGKGSHGLLTHEKPPSIPPQQQPKSLFGEESLALTKATSNSDLTLSETNVLDTPSKSAPRTLRESPLKQVKNKLSSILKSSRGLLASSAVTSAEGKSMLSPSTSRLALHLGPSTESIVAKPQNKLLDSETSSMEDAPSPTKPIARRTRASTEREKEEKRRERDAKLMTDQLDKLDKAREEERQKARVLSKEIEHIGAMKKPAISQNKKDRLVAKELFHSAKSSPQKSKVTEDTDLKQADEDCEMTDGGPSAPSRSTGMNQLGWTKETKRPIKPTKDISTKTKQAPTVIRVNTGSQNSQYHPGGNRMSTASHETAGFSSSQASSKASKATLQTKVSSQNLKGLTAVGRSKALEMSVKKKEQEDREAQRRRDVKAEIERKRAAAQEEQRKQVERQRQAEAEEKKSVQRQAAIDKAKHSRAPPPALRSQPNGPSDAALGQQRAEATRPPSRMTSGVPVSTVLPSAVKAGAKRALIPDPNDEGQSKRPASRGGPSYQMKDAKRRRTSEAFDDGDTSHPRNIKGPPVRPSAGFKKDMPSKSVFQSGYTNAPHSATRDLFKATVTAQHNSHMKASHPLDMAQISKGPIPFAPTAGSSYKTPARIGTYSAAKSTVKKATRSSPRFQNGESIELPEIQTDDEDEDDEAQSAMVAAWADTPDLRRALMRQETMDPSQIFGQPVPLNMEEVFNKSKDKWHKFRQRTSSANWSGLDRLTEDDIRKDMAARDKLRRDGGWSYEMSKGML